MSLREWTGGRIAALWVLWLILALGGALAVAVAYTLWWAPVLGAVPAESSVPGGLQLTGGGGVEVRSGVVLLVLVALVLPPAVLTAAWLRQRGRR